MPEVDRHDRLGQADAALDLVVDLLDRHLLAAADAVQLGVEHLHELDALAGQPINAVRHARSPLVARGAVARRIGYRIRRADRTDRSRHVASRLQRTAMAQAPALDGDQLDPDGLRPALPAAQPVGGRVERSVWSADDPRHALRRLRRRFTSTTTRSRPRRHTRSTSAGGV